MCWKFATSFVSISPNRFNQCLVFIHLTGAADNPHVRRLWSILHSTLSNTGHQVTAHGLCTRNWMAVGTYKTESRQGKIQGDTVKSRQSVFAMCTYSYVLCLNPVLYTSHITMYRYAPHNDVSVNGGPHIRRWSHKITYNIIKLKKTSVALVRKRTIPTERPPPVGEVSANFCG